MSLHATIALAIQVPGDAPVGAPTRDILAVVADASIILMALSIALSLGWAFFFLRRRLVRLERLVRSTGQRVVDRAGPLVDRSRDVADNVEFITRAIRTDVERLNASVRTLTERLHHASDRMEERIEEFNALIEVVQSEAESIFIDTASTVRGVTAGARAIPRNDGGRPPRGERQGPPGPDPSAGEDETKVPEPSREARRP